MQDKTLQQKKTEELLQVGKIDGYIPTDLTFQFNWEYKSYIVYYGSLKDEYRRNPKYVKITRHLLCSPIEQKARLYWVEHPEYYTLSKKEERKLIRKIGKKKFQKNITELRDKIIDRITQIKIYPIVKKEIESEYQQWYPRSWKKKMEKIYKPYYEFRYKRIMNLPGRWAHYDGDIFVQCFYIKTATGEFVSFGYNSTSGGRENLAIVGEKFAQINERKSVSTDIFVYTSDNKLKFYKTADSFVVIPGQMFRNQYPETKPVEIPKK